MQNESQLKLKTSAKAQLADSQGKFATVIRVVKYPDSDRYIDICRLCILKYKQIFCYINYI